jgi:hypothetical protein
LELRRPIDVAKRLDRFDLPRHVGILDRVHVDRLELRDPQRPGLAVGAAGCSDSEGLAMPIIE